ncbi:TPA: hypothetical protein KPJ62_002658 [Clostridioides difficile]|nr:hypothetical protein [Clostridioides difficile]
MKYKVISFLIISLFILSFSFCVSADGLSDLNGIGESKQNSVDDNSNNNITDSNLDNNDSITSNNIKNYYDNYYNNNNSSDVPEYTDNESKSSINAISRLFSGISQEDINNANIILGPVLKIARKVIAILSCIAVIATGLTTGVDLLFISAPFTRDFLYKKASSGGNGMYGMGTQDSTSKRWISDVALSCVVEFENSQNNNQNYPGMQQQPRKKDMIFSYIKRRSVHIVLFTMSLMLFSTTVLNDFGFRILEFILKYSYSFINSI